MLRVKWIGMLASLLGGLAVGSTVVAPTGRVTAQAEACQWVKIGQMAQGWYNGAVAMDQEAKRAVTFGGLDSAGDTVHGVGQVDFVSGAVSSLGATGTALTRIAPAGDIRVRPGASALYIIQGNRI